MNEKKLTNKIESQNKLILRQSKQINNLKLRIEYLESECAKKDETINSIKPLKEELMACVNRVKQYKKELEKLIEELRNMKEIINQEVYKGKWRLVKFLIK